MPYSFKLEALRRFREFEEERLQKELADAQRAQEKAASILAEFYALQEQTERDFNHQEVGNAAQAGLYRLFLQRLAADIEAQQGRIQEAEKVCTLKREELLIAMKKRKTLDRLKEKGEQVYKAQLNREEEKFINEMAINRFALKRQ